MLNISLRDKKMRMSLLIAIALPFFVFAEQVDECIPEQVYNCDCVPERPLLAPARNCCEAQWGGFAIGEYLYWKPEQDDFDLGVVNHSLGTPLDTLNDFELIPSKFSYHPGFRVGGGLKTPYDYGDFTFLWTKFNTSAKNSVVLPQEFIFMRPFSHIFALFPNSTSAFAIFGHWNVRLKDYDFDWSRAMQMTKKISLRPRVGVRYSEIKESLLCFALNNSPEELFFGTQKNSYNGWGIKAGLDGKLAVKYGVGIYTDISGSLYWSKMRFTTATEQLNVSISPSRGIQTVKRKRRQVRPMVDLAFGVDGNWCFAERFAVRISFGYEFQYWWRNYERITTQSQAAVSALNDLSFRGYDFSAGIDF